MSSHVRPTGLLAATAAAALAGSVLVATPAAAAPNPNPNGFANRVKTAEVMDHLEAFQAIADANDGSRASGTPGYDASGDYVQGLLEAAGYEVVRQEFDFVYTETVAEELTVGGTDVDVVAMEFSPNTAPGGITADLVALPTGDATPGCEASDFEGQPVAGTIVLVQRGACAFELKRTNAQAAGAVGVVVYNNEPGALNGTLGGVVEGIPAGGISLEAGEALLAQLAGGTLTSTLDVRQIQEERTTFNVIAQTPYGDTDNVIMLGAHLDSVPGGPGINDNGSGSAAILQTALELAEVAPTRNAVRFAWWGAEEAGLVGAEEYVASLSAEELEQIAGYLNFDMVGSPNYIIGVYDADESTYEAPVVVPDGSASLEQVFTDYFDRKGQPWVDTEFSGRSDYQPFILAGIPASGLFTGADDVKTEEEVALFGGTAGIIHDPNYHTPADDITNVDETALGINSQAIAYVTLLLANDPTPLVVGDKVTGGKGGKADKGSEGKAKGHDKGHEGKAKGHDKAPSHAAVHHLAA